MSVCFDNVWFLNAAELTKLDSHLSHWKSLSPVCIFICIESVELLFSFLPQTIHMNFFSVECFFMWSFRPPFVVHCFPHSSQTWNDPLSVLFSIWWAPERCFDKPFWLENTSVQLCSLHFLWDMNSKKWCNGFYIQFRQSFAKETFSYDVHLKS